MSDRFSSHRRSRDQERVYPQHLIGVAIAHLGKKYPKELYPVLELSDSLLELTEKLERVRGKLDDFEQSSIEPTWRAQN